MDLNQRPPAYKAKYPISTPLHEADNECEDQAEAEYGAGAPFVFETKYPLPVAVALVIGSFNAWGSNGPGVPRVKRSIPGLRRQTRVS